MQSHVRMSYAEAGNITSLSIGEMLCIISLRIDESKIST